MTVELPDVPDIIARHVVIRGGRTFDGQTDDVFVGVPGAGRVDIFTENRDRTEYPSGATISPQDARALAAYLVKAATLAEEMAEIERAAREADGNPAK